MSGYLIFGDIDSRDYDVFVSFSDIDTAPRRVYTKVDIVGKNGSVYIDEGKYEDVPHSYDCLVLDDEKRVSFVNAIMSKKGYQRLTDSYGTDEYYTAVLEEAIEQKTTRHRNMFKFKLVFTRKPQRFLLTGEPSQIFTATGGIENPTNQPSRPLLAVTGAGTLTVGTQTMTIIARSSASSVLYIDCEAQEAWELSGGAKLSRNDYVQNAGADFPTLQAGSNDVILGTGITRVEITPRWWKL